MTKFRLKLALILMVVFMALPAQAATDFKHLVVFGDSLSDNGIDDGYGYYRYSNGKVWPEYLAEMMKSESLDDRAWSGALSGVGNYNSNAKDWSGLLWQVEGYTPDTSPEETLAVVQIGLNDLHDPGMEIAPEQVVGNVIKALGLLAEKGIRNIMVWNLHTGVTMPGYVDEKYQWYSYYKDSKDKAYAQFAGFNALIGPAVADFAAQHPDVKITLFDADAAITEIAKNFENTTEAWHDTKFYPKKGGWFWYDHWHFMTEVHHYLAEKIHAAL